jgi:6-phosphogluconate dehydrogenase
MLALITMDRPASLDADGIREARARALETLRPFDPEEVAVRTFRAQYDGYRSVEGVTAGSETETFFEVVTELDSERWRGVPVVMRAGKRTGEACKRIAVVFKRPQPCFCEGVQYDANRVVFGIEPVDSITITFWTKRPGFDEMLEQRDFSFFLYEREEKAQYVEEYARLLDDAVRGDQTLFVSDAEIRAMWAFTDPIEQGWQSGLVPLETYAPDTRGALEAASRLDVTAPRAAGEREIGVVGLGRMGRGIALNLADHGWRVIGFNRTTSKADALAEQGVHPAHTLDDLVAALRPPRVVWVMLPAGAAIDEMLFGEDGLAEKLSPGDLVIEGGNSRYTDDAPRADRLAELGIAFIDVGVSGGPAGARHGACLMIGGDRAHFARLEALWRDISVPDGYRHFPGVGAGHFVKMVHNGIEYGMMQAIAEGFAILRESPFDIGLADAAAIYDRGSVIESRLVEWLGKAFELHGERLDDVSGKVGHTGEGEWTVEVADELGVDAPAISDAVSFRIASDENPSWTGRVLQALREQFGQHRAD